MIASTTNRNAYAGTGTVGPFAYNYRIFAYSDLRVIKTDVAGGDTVLTYGVDFTATGAGNASGTVSLTIALAVGETLTIRRVRPHTQARSVRNNGPYFAATHEDAWDDMVMQVQQLQDELDRSLKLKETLDPTAYNLILPTPTAGMVLTGTGTGFTMSALVSAASVALPGEGRTVVTLTAYLQNNRVFNAADYGAKDDLTFDSTAAIQAMLNAMGAANNTRGAHGVIPFGRYKTTSPLAPPGVNAFINSSKHTVIMYGAQIFSYDASAAARGCIQTINHINTEGTWSFEGGTLDGANAHASTRGFLMDACNTRLDRMVVRNFDIGVDYTATDPALVPIVSHISDCMIQANRIGVRCTVAASILYITGGRIEHNEEENCWLDNCGKICFVGVVFENAGDVTPAKANLYVRNSVDGAILGCYFESSPGQNHTSIVFEGITTAVFSIAFIGNRVVNNGGIGLDIGSTAGAVEAVTAHSNYYSSQTIACRLGLNAVGCKVGPDYFSDNFNPGTLWSAATNYVIGNVANLGGVATNYQCILGHINQTPPNATYWLPLLSQRYVIVGTRPNMVFDINRYAAEIYTPGITYQAFLATTIGASGLITAALGIKINGGTSVDSTIVKTAAQGLCIRGVAGSAQDMLLAGPGGVGYVKWDTGTVHAKFFGHVKADVAGMGFFCKEGGGAARMGTAALVAGTVTINTTAALAGTRIFISRAAPGGGALGHLSFTIAAGVSFTVLSTSAAEVSTIHWIIIEPS